MQAALERSLRLESVPCVTRDCEQPRSGGCVRSKARCASIGRKECLLQSIFGHRGVAGHDCSHPENCRRMALHQALECTVVSCGGKSDQVPGGC